MELEFDVHVDANALYVYMLRHTFTKAAGIQGMGVVNQDRARIF